MEKDKQEWHAISVTLPRKGEDWISHLLFELGSVGNLEEDCPDPALLATKGYFPTELGTSNVIIQQITHLLGEKGIRPLSIFSTTIKLENWAESARQMFSPIKITKDLTVISPWSDYEPAKGEDVIVINPGMAFGTGLHATTQLAARMMIEALDPRFSAKSGPASGSQGCFQSHQMQHFGSRRPVAAGFSLRKLHTLKGTATTAQITHPKGCGYRFGNSLERGDDRRVKTMCDVGCGSAILSIIAARKGVKSIEAVEIDGDARPSALENIKRNHFSKNIKIFENIKKIDKKFDLVVANILYQTILEIKDDLLRITKKGGYLILSGIMKDEDERFIKAFNGPDVRIIKKEDQDEWMAYAAIHDRKKA